MAPPPKYLITRRLIDRYMKSFTPNKPNPGEAGMNELFNCWRVHGIESEKCRPVVERMEQSSKEYSEFMKSRRELDLSKQIKCELNAPIYSFQKKGRYRSFAPRPYNFYDGIC